MSEEWEPRDGTLEQVRVFRRGAEIERSVVLEGSEERFVLRALPLELDDGSVRIEVLVPGAASIRSFRTELEAVGGSEAPLHAESDELRSAKRKLREIMLELDELRARHARAAALSIPERPQRDHGRPPPPAPDRARLELLELRASLQREARERSHELERDKRLLERTLRRLTDEHARRTVDAPSRHRVQKALYVELERCSAGARLRIVYRVRSARWAPSYRLSYDTRLHRARLAMRAVVAQRTGEDWHGARLSVSTARMDGWHDLPELASIRIGRAQAAPRSGFRPLPADGAALFDDYDRAMTAGDGRRGRGMEPVPMMAQAAMAPMEAEMSPFGAPAGGAAPTSYAAMPEQARTATAMPRAKSAAAPGGPPPAARPSPAMPAAPMSAAPAFQPQASRAKGGMLSSLLGAGGGGTADLAEETAFADDGPDGTAEAIPTSVAPAGALLDFGSLRLAAPTDAQRGALRPLDASGRIREAGRARATDELLAALSLLAADESQFGALLPPAAHSYPEALLGFDFQYDAVGRADVPSDGAFHTLAICEAEGAASLLHVTVPREDPAAFRTLELESPLEGAVLRGPVDVYLDGSLAVSGSLASTASRGLLRVCIGVDESVRVARNVRFREESAGLMGGSSSLVHEVEVELRNNSADAVRLEVRERLPVLQKGEEEIEIRLGKVSPPWQDLVQDEPPLEGGKRWVLDLAAGQQATLAAEYAVRISAKNELVGGNRRD